MSDKREVAVVVGVGPGLGAALARRFAEAGMAVALAARRLETTGPLAADLGGRAYACDATLDAEVRRLFADVEADLGTPSLTVYNAGSYAPGTVLETDVASFERAWRVGCLGGFLVGREAGRRMREAGRGTLIFTGATASLRGSAGFANLAVGKFGLRALAQSLAREMHPDGVHVAHVILDGQVASERLAGLAAERPEDALLSPDAIADSYLHLHRQHRSAWTQELDLRPWVERF